MGDPRKFKNKTNKPKKLWEKDRIKVESKLKREFGLKNMREIWLAKEELRKYRREARRLLSLPKEEREKEEKKLLTKLKKIGIFSDSNTVEDVLGLTERNLLERRLQTQVFRLGLAKTIKQARQLITHRFIKVGGTIVDAPSYQVKAGEEKIISYAKPIKLEEEIKEEPENKEEVKENGGQKE